MTKNPSRGFTLIELLVAISIIGLLSSVVLSSVNTARKKADNTQRNQIAEEYRKALMLSYDANGGYPLTMPLSPTAGSNYCLGDYPPLANYTTTNVCGGSSTATYPLHENSTLETAVAQYLPALPVMKIVQYTFVGTTYRDKMPLYECLTASGGKCTSANMRWLLEGVGHCIRGSDEVSFAGLFTICNFILN